MSTKRLVTDLRSRFGEKFLNANLDVADQWVELSPEGLVEICRYLRDTPQLSFDMLNCITAVDYLHTDPRKAKKADWEPHTEVIYHLSSISRKHTLVVKVMLPRWKDGVEGELPEIDSVSGVWSTADWHEREVFDLSGVRFMGHPDLRRILCPEDWVGHPLRRDYEMPLEYHGIRDR